MLRKILLVFVIIQCLTFFVIHSTFAEEDNLSQPDMTDGEKNIALVGNFVPNEYGLKVLENIEKNNPEHIFFLGDLGYDTPENWFAFSDRLGKERISVVIGNHDRENAKEILGHYGLNREFYSIDYENIHFIILASDLDYTKNSEQMKFLEDDLVKANNNSKIKWKIVLIHKPMIYKDYYVKNDPGLTNGVALKEGLQPTLDAYGVDMIISGHAHLYERSFPLKFNNVLTSNEKSTYIDPEGAIHVIVGTAGADKHHNQYPQTFEEWAVVKNPDVYGFFNLRIPDDKNRLIFEFITNEGYVLDRFQIFETDDSFKTKLDVLSGADLTNADLSGADLTNADLSGADLTNADLSGADLTNADLFGADLTNANLSFTNLKNIDFSNVKIKDVKFIGVTFTDMDLSGLDLSEKNLAGSSFLRTNLSEANLEKSNLSWANFEQVNLFNTNLKHAELLRANLSEADLSNTELEYSNLMNSNLSKIDFSNVKLTNVKLEKTNLSYSNFSNVDLTGMNLNGANLYGVHLIGKDLRNTNLKNANFIGYKIDDEKWWDYLGLNRNGGIIDHAGVDKFGEKLYGTDLSGVDLRGTDLSGVNLSGIDITHANLSDLDFSNTNIERANLAKTDLSGADLSGKNLSQVNLSGADLSGADLTNADFTDMNFFKFQFFGTDLSGADLTNADLSGADLAWGFFYGLDLSGTILECYNHSICK